MLRGSKKLFLISACEAISFNSNHHGVEVPIAISYIIESIRRTGEYASNDKSPHH